MSELKDISKKMMEKDGYKTIDIDGSTYAIKLLPSLIALDVAKDIFSMIAPVLGGMFEEDESASIERASLIISEQLPKLDVQALSDILLSDVLKEGEKVDVKSFVGPDGAYIILKLLEFSISENIAGFLFKMLQEKGFQITSLSDLIQPSAQQQKQQDKE